MNEPKVRFKGFEGEWEEKNFVDFFEFLKNNSLSRADLCQDGKVKNVHYGDVLIKFSEFLDVSKEEIPYIKDSELADTLYKSCHLESGDVVFADAAEDNTVGKCTEIINDDNEPIVSGLHTIPVRPQQKLASKYLGFYLNSPFYHDQLLIHIQGSKISSISKTAISQTHVAYPTDKTEQRRIASYFTHLDTLIEASRQKVEKLKQVKAASLQSFFPTHGQRTPKIRFKGCEGEWKVVKLGEMYERRNERNDLTYGIDKIISVANMYFRGDSVVSSLDYLRSYNIFKLGDIAFEGNKSKDFAHGRFVENSIGDGIVSHVFVVLKRKDGAYDLNFWKYYINNERIMGPILGRCTKASTMMNDIVVDDFLKESVLVPSLEEQQKIGKYLSTLDTLLTLERQRYAKLQQVKRASLTQMFV